MKEKDIQNRFHNGKVLTTKKKNTEIIYLTLLIIVHPIYKFKIT